VDVGNARRRAAARLRAAGIDAADAEASWLLEAVTGLTRAEQVLGRGRPLGELEAVRLEEALLRREAREPLQLVLGETTFYGLRVVVRPGVLVPRPETERLVELVLQDAPAPGSRPWRVLDVGTGSGVVALAIAAERRDAVVVACDVDPVAVALARANASALSLPVEVFESDLLAHPAVRAAARRADTVVANLPYLPDGDRERVAEEVRWDPEHALYAGPDGLDVARPFLHAAASTLRPGAVVWLELDARNAATLAIESTRAGWRDARLARDLSGLQRFLRLRRPSAARPSAWTRAAAARRRSRRTRRRG
jgi:release factor glutamine methyltransferase